MSNTQKQELITEIVTLLQAKLEFDTQTEISEIPAKPVNDNAALEMLTIKECCQVIKGLSEHTVRQLVKQGKLPHIRTGAGKNGKILISRNALTGYFDGISTERSVK